MTFLAYIALAAVILVPWVVGSVVMLSKLLAD
jgi:hypothetical protein